MTQTEVEILTCCLSIINNGNFEGFRDLVVALWFTKNKNVWNGEI